MDLHDTETRGRGDAESKHKTYFQSVMLNFTELKTIELKNVDGFALWNFNRPYIPQTAGHRPSVAQLICIDEAHETVSSPDDGRTVTPLVKYFLEVVSKLFGAETVTDS